MDTQLVEQLNRWFGANVFRADLGRALAIGPLVVIGVLVVVAWSTPRSNAPVGRSELLLGIVAAVGALLVNLALGHLYYRARPFLVSTIGGSCTRSWAGSRGTSPRRPARAPGPATDRGERQGWRASPTGS